MGVSLPNTPLRACQRFMILQKRFDQIAKQRGILGQDFRRLQTPFPRRSAGMICYSQLMRFASLVVSSTPFTNIHIPSRRRFQKRKRIPSSHHATRQTVKLWKRDVVLSLLGLLTRIDAPGISGLLPVDAPLRTVIYAFMGKQLLTSLLINQRAASTALDVAFHVKTIFRELHFTLPLKPYSRSAAVAETYPCLMSLKTSCGSRSWGSP